MFVKNPLTKRNKSVIRMKLNVKVTIDNNSFSPFSTIPVGDLCSTPFSLPLRSAPALSGSPPVCFSHTPSFPLSSLSTEVPPKTLPFWVSRISLSSPPPATAIAPGMKPRRACELCINGEAVVHCEPDSAYLCRACDAHVHGANFLVARHPRRPLCRECGVLDPDQRPVSGLAFLPFRCFVICRSCNDAYQGDGEGDGGSGSDSDSDSESASSSCCSSSLRSVTTSSCVSTAGSEAAARSGAGIAGIKVACSRSSGATELSDSADRRRRWRAAAGRELDARTDAVVVSWCRRIGLDDARASGAASRALISAVRMMTGAPLRVAAAAAVWHAARVSCAEAAAMGGRRGEGALLRRLEACSGVPAKVIVVAEARLARAIRRRHVADEEEEGWAECS